MSDLAEKLFGEQKSMGAMEAAIQGVKIGIDSFAPGLKDAPGEIGAELKDMAAHGAHELAAALFNGSAFVMYPRGGSREDHGVHGPEMSKEGPEQQMERGM